MATEFREPRESELEEVAFVSLIGFDSDREQVTLSHVLDRYRLMTPLACFEDGRPVAVLTVIPFAAVYEGADIGFGGVSSVACLPEERRRGLVGRLLTHALDYMRQHGMALSGLYTPHPSLYRRYGWSVTHRVLHYTFHPKDLRLRWAERPQGRARRVGEDDWPLLDSLYSRRALSRNGYLRRSEAWWRQAVFRFLYDRKRELNDVAVWCDGSGEPSGYLVYRARQDRSPAARGNFFSVSDFVALDGNAYAGLVRYVLSFDLARQIEWYADGDDPLMSVVDEAQRVNVESNYGMMLRLVDVEKALGERPTPVTEGLSLTLAVRDDVAPWNEGTYRLEASDRRIEVRRTDGEAGLSCDAGNLAPLFNGYLSPGEAARAGLIAVHDAKALAAADRIFVVSRPPSTADFF
ncbi:MAG: GNAT family N-acetyltransferase [Chloroflexi bacterium]|nr:GNAT family N-acetyltransferase [Chloroflexota bacterium]